MHPSCHAPKTTTNPEPSNTSEPIVKNETTPSPSPETIEETVDQITKVPKAPPKQARKQDKLKYLEDLENNLKKTQEKVAKQKIKE